MLRRAAMSQLGPPQNRKSSRCPRLQQLPLYHFTTSPFRYFTTSPLHHLTGVSQTSAALCLAVLPTPSGASLCLRRRFAWDLTRHCTIVLSHRTDRLVLSTWEANISPSLPEPPLLQASPLVCIIIVVGYNRRLPLPLHFPSSRHFPLILVILLPYPNTFC